jgi:tetratricopeptide (TPR) repeat protein
VYWSALLRDEHNNLRAALKWALGGGHAELGLQLTGALRDYWFYEGRTAEGLAWTEWALDTAKDAPPALRARALNTAGLMCYDQADHKRGERYNREALALFRDLGDDHGTAWALGFLGVQALVSPAECIEGIRLLEEALALFRELDYKPGITQVLIGLGEVARLGGDYERAGKAYREAIGIAREEDDKMSEAKAFGNLSYVAQQQGEYARAAELLTRGLRLFRELGTRRYICQNLAGLAGPIVAQGYPQAAARLLGASEAFLETMVIGLQAGDRPNIERYVVTVREQLDNAAFDAAWAEGRAMSFEQAVSYALEWGELAAAAPRAEIVWDAADEDLR